MTTALDNTWGAGLAFAPFDLTGDASYDLGADISIHALTKYPSGGGDVLMGSVITRSPALHRKIQELHMHLGLGVGANDAEAVLRSLPSIALRYRAHDVAARTLAHWLQQQSPVVQVLHPALPQARLAKLRQGFAQREVVLLALAERLLSPHPLLAFLIKACVAALKKFPEFNSSLDGDALIYKQFWHIGFAADTPNGLVVPVIKDADKKGVLQISEEMGALAKKARDGKLGPADMSGATFTISSLGGIGGRYFTPIINAPEVAILGVCRSNIEPVWDGKAFQPRLMLPLSLTWDHRVIDGAAAARFNAYLGQILGDFRRVLL